MSHTVEKHSHLSAEQETLLHGLKDAEIKLRSGDLYHLDSYETGKNGVNVLAHLTMGSSNETKTPDSELSDELLVVDIRNAERDSQGAKVFNDQLLDQSVDFLIIDPKQLDWENGTGYKGLRKGEQFTYGRPVQGQTAPGDPRWRFEKTSSLTSRNHVTFTVDDMGEIYVEDKHSANGTRVATGVAAHERMGNAEPVIEKTVPRVDAAPKQVSERLTQTIQGEGIILSEESIANFVENASRPDQPELTRALAQVDALKPKAAILLNDTEFYFGQVFTTDGGVRKHIVAYTKGVDEQKLSPRLFYKSFSDGGWRAAPYIFSDGVYSKGKNTDAGGYVQETKPVEVIGQILEAIDQYPPVADTTHANLQSLFNIERLMNNEVFDYNDQVNSEKLSDEWASVLYDAYEPGIGYLNDPDQARNTIENMNLPAGFEPDFSESPKSTYTLNHTIAGKLDISVYGANYHNQKLEWHVAEDAEGNVWLDKVAVENSGTTSYGTAKNVLRLGALSAKPFEYESQVRGMIPGVDFESIAGTRYVDLRQKYWGKMPWVQKYKTSKR